MLTLMLLTGTTALAQTIQNPGFDTPQDTICALPVGWRPKKLLDIALTLDSTVAQSGGRSLKVYTVDNYGEFTALSFIGLPGVRSFGTHTGGFTTGNDDYELPDGARFFVAQSIGKDRAI